MIMTTLVAAIALGIAAQIIAERFQIPAILPLLVLGGLFGPAALALFEPSALGPVMVDLIHLGVAIILFEGGLSLDPNACSRWAGPVRNLLTIGVVVTGTGAAWLAHVLVGMPWSTASLFGAVMTVTGPTVDRAALAAHDRSQHGQDGLDIRGTDHRSDWGCVGLPGAPGD